jgi:3-phenylpropionate/trans-cinnamate dioxygenase ferredoxin reductase subunit
MSPDSSSVTTAERPEETMVIVGAGQAGGWAAQTLRKVGFAGRVVMIGDENHPPHERPPLSKAVLSGEAAPESTWLQKPDAFSALALDWRPASRVVRIDRGAKALEMADGESIRYDKLILCTGGRARPLAVPGADAVAVHTLRTIDDALALAPLLAPGRTLVVIGGGWIGLEVAATARKKGADVVVIEAQSRLCERTVPREISEHLLALHRSNGTRVLLGAGVAGLEARATRAAGRRTPTSSPPATSPSPRTHGLGAGCGSSRGRTRRNRAWPQLDPHSVSKSTTSHCPGSGRTNTA